MRVIVNIHSDRAAAFAGWRAREFHVNDKKEADLDEILKAVVMPGGSLLKDYIMKDDSLMKYWILYVNGVRMKGALDIKLRVKDSTQIHLMDNLRSGSNK
jgi:hypothetical protein